MLRWTIGNQRKRPMIKDIDEFRLTEEEEEYFTSANETADLMKDLANRGINPAAAMGGALTQLLTQLFLGSPSQSEALGILASCLAQASENSEKFDSLINSLSDSSKVH